MFCVKCMMREELQRALDAGCDLIGVNTRDLRTFKVDLETAFALAEKFPAEWCEWRRAGFILRRMWRGCGRRGMTRFWWGSR